MIQEQGRFAVGGTVVSYEPGSGFVFPRGELPPPMPSATGPLEGVAVPEAEFARRTRIPIVVCYGDNIPTVLSKDFGEDSRHGGRATLVHLPDQGVRGNTHFPFSDLNNLQIADLLSAFLAQNGLDRP